MHTRQAYLVPADADEALRFAAEHSPSLFLAGGTSRTLRFAAPRTTLIDLGALSLAAIRADDAHVAIGAMAPLARLLDSPRVRSLADGILATAVRSTGHPAWRNHATLGGRLMDRDADDALTAALVVQRCRARWQAAPGAAVKDVRLDELDEDRPGLLLEVQITPERGWRFALRALGLTAYDAPLAAVAAAIEIRDGRVHASRCAAAGLGIPCRRASHAQSALDGMTWPPTRFAAVQTAFRRDIRPIDDTRATAAFRVHVASVLLGRVLHDLATVAGGGA